MSSPSSGIELVVSRFQEDLRWLKRVPPGIQILIYNKGADDPLPLSLRERQNVRVVSLPNVGLEAHSYLTHLVSRYDSLAPVTLFCQGHPFDHAPDFHDRISALAEGKERPDPFLWYGFIEDTDDRFGRRLFVPWSKNPERLELATGRLHEELFGQPSPELFHFRCGAQFAVSSEGVGKRPAVFYKRALELSLSFPLAVHSLERMWDRFFGDPVIDPVTLGAEGVRYHKRIRRLESQEMSRVNSPADSV
jgi:hypothetical protein